MGFSKLNIHEKVMKGLTEMGFEIPTSIQQRCIPEIKKGHDIVGQSLTGSGKTAAFGIPLLEQVTPGEGIQALILTPTRELCLQVRDNLEKMGKYVPLNIKSIFGGVGYYQQREDILIAEIIVATPGRLLDHLNQGNISLEKVKFVVLDEADRMVDMGFSKDVEKILRKTASKRQTTMFSATMPPEAKHIIKTFLHEPIYITEQLQVDNELLKQKVYYIRQEDKFSLLVHLLKQNTGNAIIFCGKKRTVDKLSRNIRKQGFAVMPIHGDIVQSKRQMAIKMFKDKKIDFLIATDVAARGIDIDHVSHIYNYDTPKTPDEYTHRIGRTARAGKKGEAINLVSENDNAQFKDILKVRKEMTEEALPEFEKLVFEKGSHSRDFDRDSGRSFGRSSGRDFGRHPKDNYRGGKGSGRSSREFFRNRDENSPRNKFGPKTESSESSPSESVSRDSYGNRSSGSSYGRSSGGYRGNYGRSSSGYGQRSSNYRGNSEGGRSSHGGYGRSSSGESSGYGRSSGRSSYGRSSNGGRSPGGYRGNSGGGYGRSSGGSSGYGRSSEGSSSGRSPSGGYGRSSSGYGRDSGESSGRSFGDRSGAPRSSFPNKFSHAKPKSFSHKRSGEASKPRNFGKRRNYVNKKSNRN